MDPREKPHGKGKGAKVTGKPTLGVQHYRQEEWWKQSSGRKTSNHQWGGQSGVGKGKGGAYSGAWSGGGRGSGRW